MVPAVEVLRTPAQEKISPSAFVTGFTDGQAARSRNVPLSAYLRVGIDDYAKGFRAGFFKRGAVAAKIELRTPRPVANM
jgi:hypothetical protein